MRLQGPFGLCNFYFPKYTRSKLQGPNDSIKSNFLRNVVMDGSYPKMPAITDFLIWTYHIICTICVIYVVTFCNFAGSCLHTKNGVNTICALKWLICLFLCHLWRLHHLSLLWRLCCSWRHISCSNTLCCVCCLCCLCRHIL